MTEPSPALRTAPKRLIALDGLRLFAAIFVVFYHYTARKGPVWDGSVVWPHLGAISQYGYLGVNLFFLISGFVILMTAWRQDIKGYVASRVSRLFPAYWFCVAATTVLLLVIWQGKSKLSIWDAITNLTMAQEAFGMDHVDGVYWTLWAELRFYFLIGIFMYVGITRQRIVTLCSIWPVAAAMAHHAKMDLIADILIWPYAPYFAAGMIFYLIYKDGNSKLLWFLIAFEWIYTIPYTIDHAHWINRKLSYFQASDATTVAATVVCFAMVAACGSRIALKIQWRWLTAGGLLTYPLYLIHEWWGWYCLKIFHAHFSAWIALIGSILAMFLAAYLIQRFMEAPLTWRIRRWINEDLTRVAALDRAR